MQLDEIATKTYGSRQSKPRRTKQGKYGIATYADVIYEYAVPRNKFQLANRMDYDEMERIDDQLSEWAKGLSQNGLAFRESRRAPGEESGMTGMFVWVTRVPANISFDAFVKKIDSLISEVLS